MENMKINRTTLWKNLDKAKKLQLIEKDELGKYHLTQLGRINVESAELPILSKTLRVRSQVIDLLGKDSGIPLTKVTIIGNDSQRIVDLDSKTDASKKFWTVDGLWLPENNTFLKASAATLVDTILDLKAKNIGLNTVLDHEFREQFSIFNWHTNFPGFDFRRRYGKLAAGTKFKVLIEFDGESLSKVYNDEEMENEIAHNRARRDKWFKEVLASDKAKLVDKVIGLLGQGTNLSDRDLSSMRLFSSPNELRDTLDTYFSLYKLGHNERHQKEIIRHGLNSGLFEIEKKILYHLRVNRSKLNEFSSFVVTESETNKTQLSKDHSLYSKRSDSYPENRYSNLKDLTVSVRHEIQEFHDIFFSLMTSAVEAFQDAQIHADKINKEPDKKKGVIHNSFSEQSIADLIQELLRVFHIKMNLYVSRSISFWPNKIKNRKDLDRINSIVLKQIAEMHRQLRQLLDPIYGGDFNGYLDTYALKKNGFSMNLQNVKRYNDPSLNKAIEAIQNSCRSLYEECQALAHPEPQSLEINYKYNE
jgi:hypothetical protein